MAAGAGRSYRWNVRWASRYLGALVGVISGGIGQSNSIQFIVDDRV